MIDVLVSGGIVCTFCTIWWKSHKKNVEFNSQAKGTQDMLDNFIKINEIEYMDFTLANSADASQVKKKYIDTSIVKRIGPELKTGYDFFHIKVDAGYDTLMHMHKFSNEFFYILSGEVEFSGSGTEPPRTYGPGGYFYIGNNGYHRITSNVSAEFIVVAKPPIIVSI